MYSQQIKFNNSQLIRSLRLVIAIIASYIVSLILHIPADWAMITASVVLFDQDTVGGTIGRSMFRFLATLIGGAICVFCIFLFPNNPFMVWVIIMISNFCYAYFYMGTKRSYIGLISSTTLSLLLMSSHPDLQTTIYRIIDITIGGISALLAMILFFPEYAISKARKLIIKSLQDITSIIQEIKSHSHIEQVWQHIATVETKFINHILDFNKTIEESKHEIKAHRNPEIIQRYTECLLQIRRLYRLIVIIFYYELEDNHLNDPIINQILDQFTYILTDLKNFEQLSANDIMSHHTRTNQLIYNISENTLHKTLKHFCNELVVLYNILVPDSQ